MSTSIRDAVTLGPHRAALLALGYTTVEHFVSVARTSGPYLAAYLGVSSLSNLVADAEAMDFESRVVTDVNSYPIGVGLDKIPRYHRAVAPMLSPATKENLSDEAFAPDFLLPESTDLRSTLVPIRDQGPIRQTCVAFAAIAVYEQSLMNHGVSRKLSEQFLYWGCKRNDGFPSLAGTLLEVAFAFLQSDGCCLATTWTYNPGLVTGNEGEGPPPPQAAPEAVQSRLSVFRQLASTAVDDIRSTLASGFCVAVTIPAFRSWWENPAVIASGDIILPAPMEVPQGSHSVCLAGYANQPNAPGLGGGHFIVRNSWGTRWGIQSSLGPGYGTLPYAFVDRYGLEAFALN